MVSYGDCFKASYRGETIYGIVCETKGTKAVKVKLEGLPGVWFTINNNAWPVERVTAVAYARRNTLDNYERLWYYAAEIERELSR